MSRYPPAAARHEACRRLRLDVTGSVQGVGFRPFIHRLAVSEGLAGYVRNTGEGVSLEIEGPDSALERFLARLDKEITPPAGIQSRRSRQLPTRGDRHFVIAPSARRGRCSALVLPDLATCAKCLEEIFDPDDRRYRYPFTTCVHCGPRYSLIDAIPYDRARTAMRHFAMCTACRAEYNDPASRRFHAETNACANCGPQLALWDAAGNVLSTHHQALTTAAAALRRGGILALKGLGGFQLLVDARNDAAVSRLRERKNRPAKPFAVMVPSLADASTFTDIGAEEQRLLLSPAAPIVLLRANSRAERPPAPDVAPDNPWLGLMLPYTPLHHLLMRELGFPVVATSGNRSGEPIVSEAGEALDRLADVADLFLVHDRPIRRPVDDSVARVLAGREMVLRCARGYAPLTVTDPAASAPALGLGAHQKSSLALAGGGRFVLGAHVGDLDSGEARTAYTNAVAAMTALYNAHPQIVACDRHPDYYSTAVADALGPTVRRVPHHLAHVLAGMADNGLLDEPVLGVAWDGAGYGGDGTLWGGEFLAVDGGRYRRAAYLLPFRLPGGEACMREPRRCALGALYESFGPAVLEMADLAPVSEFTAADRRVLATMLARGINAPWSSSAGRLFDAAAAILGLRQKTSFEGEAAMAVEFAAERAAGSLPLAPAGLCDGKFALIIDWRPMLRAMVRARRDGVSAGDLATAFHHELVEAIVNVAKRVGTTRVLLTGGCFQNGLLTERAVSRLRESGFVPYWHCRVPPNDGGLAVGQAAFAARPLYEERV